MRVGFVADKGFSLLVILVDETVQVDSTATAVTGKSTIAACANTGGATPCEATVQIQAVSAEDPLWWL